MKTDLQQNFKGMKESVKSNLSTIRTIIGQAQLLADLAQKLNHSQSDSQTETQKEVQKIREEIKKIQTELVGVIDKQIKNNDEIFNLYTKLLEKVDLK